MRPFKSLNEQEILALAIGLEEEDGRIYADLAEAVKQTHPAHAEEFRRLREEEDGHRARLLELYRQKFGEHVPLIRRQDVKGFIKRRPIWQQRPLNLENARKQAEVFEAETRCFYEAAARQAADPGVRKLLSDLAAEESKHERLAEALPGAEAEHEEEMAARRRLFVLQIIQPGLAGLMDGSVSTLAPLFAAAFATRDTWRTFLIGLAAAIGAGISMGFAEALSDDGKLTGRGHPLIRGTACGLMTTVGGLGHTLPYLIPHIWVATGVAVAVVLVELACISWLRHRYMDTPWTSAAFQVVLGGLLVFAAGILIGSRD